MIIKSGNMWSVWQQADLFFITTNSTIDTRGNLVIGAGIARQARDRFPGIAALWGKLIAPIPTDYHLLISPSWQTGKKLAAFQTKRHWRQDSPLGLIIASTAKLHEFAIANPQAKIKLPFPGIG